MTKCQICEKPISGHLSIDGRSDIVCGSCSLTSTVKDDDDDVGKSPFQVNTKLRKNLEEQAKLEKSLQYQDVALVPVDFVTVKSNYARNKTFLLGNNVPIFFDVMGNAKVPSYLKESLDLLIKQKPGRFSIVQDWVENSTYTVGDLVRSELAAASEVEDKPKTVYEVYLEKLGQENPNNEMFDKIKVKRGRGRPKKDKTSKE